MKITFDQLKNMLSYCVMCSTGPTIRNEQIDAFVHVIEHDLNFTDADSIVLRNLRSNKRFTLLTRDSTESIELSSRGNVTINGAQILNAMVFLEDVDRSDVLHWLDNEMSY